MDATAYLQRIGYHGPRDPTLRTLDELHAAHLYSVPFENLDIPLGRPIVLSLPALFEKLIRRRRGGFCYELNGLFGWLLREIGFEVRMLSARVFDDSVPGPEFDHLILLVGTREQVIADVGFGDSFIEPVPLGDEGRPPNAHGFRLARERDGWVLYRRRPETDWEPQYAFSLRPRRLDEFRARCQHHQTSPDSFFTGGSICSLATEGGRLTLSNERFIVTAGSTREEHTVPSPEAYLDLLRLHFGIELGADVDAGAVMAPRRRAEAPG